MSQSVFSRFILSFLAFICMAIPQSAAAETTNCPLAGAEIKDAPPSFIYQDKNIIFVDFSKVRTTLTFDIDSKRVFGSAIVHFYSSSQGYPVIDLDPQASSIVLNGNNLSVQDYNNLEVNPDTNHLRQGFKVLPQEVSAGICNTLEIEYEISTSQQANHRIIKFGLNPENQISHVDMMSDMLDIVGTIRGLGRFDAQFWERFGPANFEFDHYKHDLKLVVSSAQANLALHSVFANAEITEIVQNKEWDISYPDYFTSSSFFFHIGQTTDFDVLEREHNGIPIKVYSRKAHGYNLEQSFARITSSIDKFEQDFGAYAHPGFLAFITRVLPSGADGIEYPGATASSYAALAHEVFHSWFARGVMPKDGTAGWIDESLALWIEEGSRLIAPTFRKSGFRTATESEYERGTNLFVYSVRGLIGTLASMLNSNGYDLHTLLADFYATNVRKSVSLNDFRSFLEDQTGLYFGLFFDTYVLGTNFSGNPWHNYNLAADANADGTVDETDDALVLDAIGELGENHYLCTTEKTAELERLGFVDRNNDCILSLADTLLCNGKVATILGTQEDDHILISTSDAVVVSRGGNDTIEVDSNYNTYSSFTICSGDGDDNIRLSNGDDYVDAGNGNDVIYGGFGNDTLIGGLGRDIIYGEAGNDSIFGGGESDLRLDGGNGDDNINGNSGDDYIVGGMQNDRLVGSSGNDTIEGGHGDDVILAGDGNDLVNGGDGNDVTRGGLGNDILKGDLQRDVIYGEEGNDRIFGGGGSDKLLDGGDGNDYINGNSGEDRCAGGGGSNTLNNCPTVLD